MYFDSVDIFKLSLLIGIIILVLDADLPVVVVLAGKQYMLLRFDLQIVTTAHGMNHTFESVLIYDHPLGFCANGDYIDPHFLDYQEIMRWQKEALDR